MTNFTDEKSVVDTISGMSNVEFQKILKEFKESHEEMQRKKIGINETQGFSKIFLLFYSNHNVYLSPTIYCTHFQSILMKESFKRFLALEF